MMSVQQTLANPVGTEPLDLRKFLAKQLRKAIESGKGLHALTWFLPVIIMSQETCQAVQNARPKRGVLGLESSPVLPDGSRHYPQLIRLTRHLPVTRLDHQSILIRSV